MIRVFVDSGSSIRQEEKESLGVEILPLRYLLGENEYRDGIDLSLDEFYKIFIEQKLFPKTSLPELSELEEKVAAYTKNGDEVIIITISSGISGTHSAIKSLFEGNDKVAVIDSLTAVGGVRILVQEINKNRDKKMSEILPILEELIPRIKILAIPENLNYLYKGGRLSKADYILGSMLSIKPIISLPNGSVKVLAKKIGLKASMAHIANCLKTMKCDERYPIVPSYTYKSDNLEKLIAMTDKSFHSQMIEFDNLDPVIACHWGPNAFGYIFVSKE